MTSLFLEKDADSIYEELEDNKNEEVEDEYREDRMDQMISRYGYWGGSMIQNIEELIVKEHHEELMQFAEYLGVDYEDYLEFLHPDVDFDDVSR